MRYLVAKKILENMKVARAVSGLGHRTIKKMIENSPDEWLLFIYNEIIAQEACMGIQKAPCLNLEGFKRAEEDKACVK